MSSAVLSPLGAHNGQRRLKTLKELQAKDKRTLLEEKDQVAGKTARSAGNGDKENDGARGPVAPNAVAIQTAENFVTAKSLEEALESIDVKAEGNPAATTVEDKVEDKVEGGRASRGAGEVCDQVLRLQDASGDVPYLDFGVVELGGSKTVLFQVLNDSFDRQRLQLDRMPTEKGFALTEGPSEASSGMQVEQDEDDYDGTYYFEAQGRAQIGVRWSPTELGTTREIIHFKLRSDRQRLQCIVFGRCVGKGEALEAKHQKKKRFLAGSGKRLAHNIQKTKKHKVGGGKEGAKQAVRSRPGFTAFHTDLWRQKQERAFAAWLNMVFLAQITCCAVKNRVRAWNDCQFDAKVQNKLWDYYTKNETLKRAMLNVEKLIDSGKLALTEKGSSLFTDLRIKKQAVSAIMSYNSFWLKQGLQVILGAQMPMTEDYTDAQLRELVLNFLIEDQTAAKRLSTGGSQDGKLKSGYTKARAREFLKKFLLMVKLLDQLMMEEDTYDMPLLFRGKGKVKSSQSMVQSVIGESLHGEGNVLRHLKFHGYALSYEQAPLLEYNFKINNLAVDLRDGVRLSKLVDYMNDKREDLISKAKISSKSKAARMSNTEKVFAQMKKLGISLNGVLSRFGLLDLKPKDIVEGDQELTLQFLWRVMRDWQIPHLIKAPSLEVEIDRISDGKKIEDSYFDRDESLAAHAGERVINLLLKWAQTICAGHGLKIRNFTSSFADGHALCLIVNRYAPELLSLDSVQRVSAQGDDVSRNAPKSEREIEQVRSNFTVMNECLSHLGGVPRMLSFSDFDSYGPDEIAVISFLAFLASRMMKLSKEDRSALVIQRKWRDSKVPPQKPLETLKLWIKSAQVIERGWKAYLDRKFSSAEWLEKLEAATKIQRAYRTMTVVRGARKQVAQKIADVTRIQAVWRMRSIRTEHFQMQRSAQTIQAQFRAWSARKHFRDSFLIPRILYSGLVHKKALEQHRADEKKNLSAVLIQAHFRMMIQKRQRKDALNAIALIQKHMRREIVYRQMRSLHSSAVRIQSTFRSYIIRKQDRHAQSAAVKIQASFRAHRQMMQFKRDMAGVVKAQSMIRTWLVQQSIKQQGEAAVCVQKAYRTYIIRKQYQHAQSAAVKIQASFRAHRQMMQFKRDMAGVVKAQSMIRTWLVQQSIKQQGEAAVCVQKAYRTYIIRKQYQHAQSAAVKIQASFRAHRQMMQFKRDMAGVVKAQSMVRTWLVQQSIKQQGEAAVCVQKAYRTYIIRKQYQHAQSAAVKIQASFRAHRQMMQFKRDMAGVVKAQSMVRTWLVQQSIKQQGEAALMIQSTYKCFVAKKLLGQHKAAVCVQKAYRTYIIRKQYQHAQSAAVKIQASFRAHRQMMQFKRDMAGVVKAQSMVRTWLVQQSIKQQGEAAVCVQKAYRTYIIRKQYQHAQSAAVKIQASFRAHRQMMQFKRDMAGVVKAQSMVRTWLVQQSIKQQGEAALMIQSTYKCFVAKKLLGQHKAAVCVQKAYRTYIIRKQYQHAQSAAVKIQASFRAHRQMMQFERDMAGVVKAQSMVRTWLVQQSIKQQGEAALMIQSTYKCFVAKKLLGQHKAAVLIQSIFRGHFAKKMLSRKLEGIVLIQKYFRGHKCKKRYRRYQKMKKAMEEFARAAKLFTLKSAAAIKIQSNFRSFTCRKKFQALVLKAKAAVRIQSAWKSHEQQKRYNAVMNARSVLRKYLPFLVDRSHFLRMKRASIAIQSAYRKHHSKRVQSAGVIQKHIRSVLARIEVHKRERSIATIQAHMRSYMTRRSSSKELKSIRSRLFGASERVRANPKLSIGYQTSAALRGLVKAKTIHSAISLCKVISFSTRYSSKCCVMVYEDKTAIASLLRLMRACNRSQPHVDFLKQVMPALQNIVECGRPNAKSPVLTEELAEVPDIFTTLSELLQMFRGNPDIFQPTAKVLHALVSCGKGVGSLDALSDEMKGMKKKLEGISQILKQKLRLEKKYIDHMENKKGSDVSARESAKKVVQITKDLQSLYDILNCFGDAPAGEYSVVEPRSAKNTIVRKAFMETQNIPSLNRM